MRSKKEIERQAEANRKAHRRAEAAAVALLLQARNNAVDDDASPGEIAHGLQGDVRNAIVLARQESRDIGVGRLGAEAESAGLSLTTTAEVVGLARDWERATYLARGYANRWLRKAQELEDVKAASEATAGSLRRIAVSESSEAFTAGRTAALDVDAAIATQLLKIWDSTLDRRTCPICEDADGTIVGIDESFPQGEPGSVHAFCRCGWALLTMTESRGHALIKKV